MGPSAVVDKRSANARVVVQSVAASKPRSSSLLRVYGPSLGPYTHQK